MKKFICADTPLYHLIVIFTKQHWDQRKLLIGKDMKTLKKQQKNPNAINAVEKVIKKPVAKKKTASSKKKTPPKKK